MRCPDEIFANYGWLKNATLAKVAVHYKGGVLFFELVMLRKDICGPPG